MIPILTTIVNWLANNFKLVAVGIIILLVATIFVQDRKLEQQAEEINRVTANVRAYEEIANAEKDNTRVLQLTVNELKHSNDSLIKQASQLQKELKIKDKNLNQITVINTEGRDSVQTVIKYKHPDFNEILKLNDLTTITVTRKDSILKAKLHILNSQFLFVEEKKEYKNQYKNGWIRFWHFDWKRIRIKKYQIKNSNELIKVTDTRVIEVNNN